MAPLHARLAVLAGTLVAVWVTMAGCQVGSPHPRARLQDEGAIYLYLQPPGAEAKRGRVQIDTVAALPLDGPPIPLSLAPPDANGRLPARQRLLAAGPLPAGPYVGLGVGTAGEAPQGGARSASRLPAEDLTRIDFAFTVRRGEAAVLALVLRSAEAAAAGAPVGPAFSLYVPDRPAVGLMGFVANRGSNDITVFDKQRRQVVAAIATGRGPSGLALDQRAPRLYVALAGEDAVEVIDVLAGRVSDRIRLLPGDEPVALALTPDATTLLAANRGSNTLSVIDPIARAERARIPVGSEPRSVTIDAAGRRAYVFNAASATVSVIDVPGRRVVRSIPTGPGPVRGQLNRRGDRLSVVHELTPYVTVINPATLAVTGRFPVRGAMDAITVVPSTDLVYLGGRREPGVGVHEPFSFGPVDFLATGVGVVHMTTDGNENALYVASPEANRVLVFHRIRKDLVGELDVGDGPAWISVMGEN